jgi:hypothetical protein
MKKRHIYALLFGIPGLFVAGIIAIILFGGLAGFLWLYVFGDNPWPSYVEQLTSSLFVLFVLVAWIAFILLGYVVGKRMEDDPSVNRAHVLISAGVTVMLLLLMFIQQWSVGILGPRTESVLCSDFCIQHGYSGSGIPPEISGDRICSCYDDSGGEALRIPLDHLEADALK